MPEISPDTKEFYTPTPLRWWAFVRQLAYVIAMFTLLSGALYFGYRTFFYTAPTCFDGMQNGEEAGVDCDGSCEKICIAQIAQPSIEWAKAFKVQDGLYHAVALIANTNRVAGTRELADTLTVEEEGGGIGERKGTLTLPPAGGYP